MKFHFTDLFIPLLSKWVSENTMKVLRTVVLIIVGATFIAGFIFKYSQLYIDFDGNYISVLFLQAFLRTLVSVAIVLGVLLVIKLLLIAADAVFNIVFAVPIPSDTTVDSSTRLDLEGKMDDTVKQIIQQNLSSAQSGADYAALFLAISESKKFKRVDTKQLYSLLKRKFPPGPVVSYQHITTEIKEFGECIDDMSGSEFKNYPKKIERIMEKKTELLSEFNQIQAN